MSEWAYQERSQGFGGVVKTAHDAQAQDGDDGHGVGVHRERPAAELICQRGGEDHGEKLHAGEDNGDQERVLVSCVLD